MNFGRLKQEGGNVKGSESITFIGICTGNLDGNPSFKVRSLFWKDRNINTVLTATREWNRDLAIDHSYMVSMSHVIAHKDQLIGELVAVQRVEW